MKKTVLMTLAGGGFFWESMQFWKGISNNFNTIFVTEDDVSLPSDLPFPRNSVHTIRSVTNLSRKRRITHAVNLLYSLKDSASIFRKENPDIIICLGSSISIPLAIFGKLKGIPTVFVESITRVNHLSRTGKILLKLNLVERVYVQWPEMADSNKNIFYEGTVI